MKTLYSPFIILLGILISKSCLANADSLMVIESSSLTNGLTKNLPFDKVFYLKFSKKEGQSISSFEIKKVNNRGISQAFKENEKKRVCATYQLSGECSQYFTNGDAIIRNIIRNGKHVIIEKKNFFLIKVFPLDPKQLYQFKYTLRDAVTEDIQKTLFKAITNGADLQSKLTAAQKTSINIKSMAVASNNSSLKATLAKLKRVENKKEKGDKKIKNRANKLISIDDSIITLKNEIRTLKGIIKVKHGQLVNEVVSNNNKLEIAIPIIERYDSMVSSNPIISNQLKLIKRLHTNINKLQPKLGRVQKEYSSILASLLVCDSCNDKVTLLKRNRLDSNQYMLRPSFYKLNSLVNTGQLPIDYKIASDKVELKNYSKRRENYLLTASYLENLLGIAEVNMLSYDKSLLESLDSIYQIIDSLKVLDKNVEQIGKKIDSYKFGETRVVGKYKPTFVGGSSEGNATISTKSKFSVRPDFGVAFASNIAKTGDYSSSFNTIIPFFGVRLNFRPLDPDYPFQNIPYKNFWHRSSVNISYSFTSLADDDSRFNLYENRSFLVGYGFRINNAVNLTAGGVFFQRENPDPFVSGKQMAVIPFVGASVDLDIFDTFNKLFNVFSK